MNVLWTVITIVAVVAVLGAAAWVFVIAPLVVPNRRPRA
jgi:hypothetical protein